jgi:hypothetical protein
MAHWRERFRTAKQGEAEPGRKKDAPRVSPRGVFLAGATGYGEFLAQAMALVLGYAGGPEGAERPPEPGLLGASFEAPFTTNQGRAVHSNLSAAPGDT